jgi:hypothetical protein
LVRENVDNVSINSQSEVIMKSVLNFDVPYENYDDYAKGKEALIAYHNEMVKLYPFAYFWSFEELVRYVTTRPQGHKFAIEGIGLGIINSEASNKIVQDAMRNLAQAGRGKVPSNVTAFSQAIAGQLSTTINYVDLSFIVSESVAQVIDATAKVGGKLVDIGDAALDSTKSLISSTKWIVPVLILGAAVVAYPILAKKYL